jgi:predicted exporter
VSTALGKGIIITCFLFVALIVIVTKIRVSTDLALFLPEPVSKVERLLHHQLDNGASTNIIFLGFSGLPAAELAAFNQRITEKLRQSDTFKKVTNNAASLSESGLKFLEVNRYLLTHNDLSEQFSVSGFNTALNARLEGLLSSSAPIEKRYIRKDPTGEIVGLLSDWQGKISRHKRPVELHGVWFSDDRTRTLLILEIAADISKLANQIAAVMEIRSIYDSIKQPGLEKIMTGPAVFAVESGEDIRADVKNLTLMAVVLVVLFLLTAYRSFRMVVLVVSPLLVGIIIATATILLIYGKIHGITLAFGITLAGVAVDYPIHLLTGLGGDATQDQARIAKIWRTLRLGVFSTVIAYAAFLVSGFGGMQQLGLFTIVGLAAAAVFSRWVLPLLAVKRSGKQPGLIKFHQWLKVLGQNATRFRWLVLCALIISLAAMVFVDRTVLHLNVDSLSPVKNERRAEGKLLRGDLGFWFGGSMMLVTAGNKEEVLQFSESLQSDLDVLVNDGVIEGYDMAAHFLPSMKRQALRKSQIADLEVLRSNLEQALEGLPFKKGIFEPFFEEISGTADLPLVDPGALEKTAIGKKLNPLLFDFEDEAGGVILLHSVIDEDKMRALANQHEGLYYMHLKTASTDLVARSVDRVSVIMLICIVLIYGVLAMSFRSLRRPLKIMVPALSAAVVAAAVLVFSGNPLSIFHLISLLLVVGLGLDYALFFNRLPENNDEWDTTFRSLWVCGTTTILVFGVLMFSQTPPLEAIGVTVALGALMSIIFAAMWAATPESE